MEKSAGDTADTVDPAKQHETKDRRQEMAQHPGEEADGDEDQQKCQDNSYRMRQG